MTKEHYDALIIGGGPGGSTAATFLSRAGKRVLLLEKERFPRFHIGESLLPYNRRIFDELGVLSKLQAAGFPRKFGAQFALGNGSKSIGFVFGQGRFTEEPEAIQVERAVFDKLLLDHARESGAEVREGFTVSKFQRRNGAVAITGHQDDGASHEFSASFLIDASGRGNLTGNQEQLRTIHPKLRKLAIFGHFTGVKLDEGAKGGDTIIIRLRDKWFWIIPVSREKTSVGCVLDQSEFAASKSSPEMLFRQFVESSAPLRERMKASQLVGQFHVTSDFSYRNRRLVGPRLLRVGDAAGFLDPIFSSGVFIAMFSGKLASEAVLKAIDRDEDGTRSFLPYERRVGRAMDFYWEMVEQFYTTPFMEVFLEPRERFQLASAVNAALAGQLEGKWHLRWRMRLFFWLVKWQGQKPFLPRITFD